MAQIEIKVRERTYYTMEGFVKSWLIEEGDTVENEQAVLKIKSGEVTVDVTSTSAGFLMTRLVKEGDEVKVGTTIAVVETDLSLQPKKEKKEPENLWGVEIRLGVICEHCDNAIPVNGFTEEVKCHKCNEVTFLKDKLKWAEILNYQNPGIDIFTATRKHNYGEGDYGAWQPVKLKTWRKWPQCTKCNYSFKRADIGKALENNGLMTCPSCSASKQMKPAPGFIKQIFPEVLYSIDSLPADAQVSGKSIHSSNPVVMACMSCGGSLSIDGTTRLVPCKFCGSNNYLPDDLWFALHPQPKMEDWLIVFGTKE